jgi:type-F conjugative transfer system pilin assembly protein TrbC
MQRLTSRLVVRALGSALVAGLVTVAAAQTPPSGAQLEAAIEQARRQSAQVLRQGGVDPAREAAPPTGGAAAPALPDVNAAAEAARRRSERVLAQPQRAPTPSYRDVYGLPSQPAPRTAPNLPHDTTRGVDPATLAARFRELPGAQAEATDELLIFVSASMPMRTLVRLGHQAKAAGASLVVRGVKGGLQQRNLIAAFADQMREVAATGADLQIHPELFARHQVTAVPTFVLARPSADCGRDACELQREILVGDVSLDFALERFLESRDPELVLLARARLARLERLP